MSSIPVTTAGRSDQSRAVLVVHAPEYGDAVPSPDQTVYDAYPDRCRQLKLDGSRCRGKAIPDKQNLCMVHSRKEPDDEG